MATSYLLFVSDLWRKHKSTRQSENSRALEKLFRMVTETLSQSLTLLFSCCVISGVTYLSDALGFLSTN